METSMAESDVTAMKETLRAQQQLLQKLYVELDQEREASATAASEAMDMILRLQGEKAAVKMEASHYKRMAEEKIGHAEATLEVFEELMYQKEMEIASLEFQVLAYKHKLLTMGSDFNVSELEFAEDLLLSSRNESNDDQTNGESGQSSSSSVRRLHSLPPIPYKNTLRVNRKRDRSPSPFPVPDTSPITMEGADREGTSPSLDLPRKQIDFAFGTLDSYWNQIQKLDEKVKVISDCKESSGGGEILRSRRGRSCSIFSHASTKISSDQTDRDTVSSPTVNVNNVHDVFEVPQTTEKHSEVSEPGKRRLEKWITDVDSRLTKPDSMSEEIIESNIKHDMDRLRNMLGTQHEIRKACPKDMKTVSWKKKEGGDVDGNAQGEFQKLHQRIDRLEMERTSVGHNEGDGEEQLRLLKDIQSQLNSIQLEIRSKKNKKSSPRVEDISLGPLQEAMLYFWI